MMRTRLRRWGAAGAAVALLALALSAVTAGPALATTGKTIGSGSVPVDSGPGSGNSALASIAVGTTVSFSCFVAGQDVTGPYGTEDLWDALDSGGYVPDALIFTGSNSAVVPACPSAQFGTGTYPVAWTGGGGVQPMSAPSAGSSADGGVIGDGTLVAVACETTGDTVTDSAGFTSNIWEQLSSGAYIPNVDIDTQVNGATPGVSTCAAPPPSSGGGGGGGSGAGGGSGGGGTSGGSGGGTSGGGSAPSGGGSSGGGGGSTPSMPAHAADPCAPALGIGSQVTTSYFLGTQTSFSRSASLYQLCEGFPFSAGHGYSTAMKCAVVAAIISLGGDPEANEEMDGLCEDTDIADAYQSNDWLGVPGGWACDQFAEIFSTGMGIIAAGATAETGAGVEIGVGVYRLLNASLKVVCGATYDGGFWTWGYNNEVSHEAQIAAEVVTNKNMCLRYHTVFGDVFWEAHAC